MAPADNDSDFEITHSWEEIINWYTPSSRSRAGSLSELSAVSGSTAAQSGRFSDTTKTQVKAMYGGSARCWVCHGGMADCAHVFAKEDGQVCHFRTDRWDKAGLIPSGANLKSKENAILLCKSCHCQYDNAYHPGIVFFPSDLVFFIEWEKADQARRKEAAKNGIYERRNPPTAAAYKAHQVEKASIDPNSVGGLYRTAVLDTFFASDLPRSLRREVLEYRTRLKHWHGEPMYTVRRAFIILGTLQVKLLDPEIKRQLRELQDLYTSDDLPVDDDDSDDDFLLRSVNRLNRGTKRPHSELEDENNAGPSGSVHAKPDDGQCPGDLETSRKDGRDCLGGSLQRLTRRCRSFDEKLASCDLLLSHHKLAQRWQLGPNMTAEDAIRIRSNLMAPA
ncbi:hypothetical protein F1880_007671 [Penicillium rolfsii]|nr:hypothetical protein F1880_007671 [Penicillium rolfsii]